jgi:hypothetical protein
VFKEGATCTLSRLEMMLPALRSVKNKIIMYYLIHEYSYINFYAQVWGQGDFNEEAVTYSDMSSQWYRFYMQFSMRCAVRCAVDGRLVGPDKEILRSDGRNHMTGQGRAYDGAYNGLTRHSTPLGTPLL